VRFLVAGKRRPTLLCVAISAMLSTSLEAQGVAPSRITLAPIGEVIGANNPGSVFTTVFSVVNGSPDTLHVIPEIQAPAGWAVILGESPFHLSPRQSDTWVISVGIPARTIAGKYAVRVRLQDTKLAPRSGSSDSIVIRVKEHRGLALTLLDRPTYVIAGASYQLSFLLRNRGNAPAIVVLSAQTPTGRAISVDPGRVSLQPDESRTVDVRVAALRKGTSGNEEVVELHATDQASPESDQISSARVTVVEQGNAVEPFVTVPAQIKIRAGGQSAVAPYELIGSGLLREGSPEQIDFAFRGPAAKSSPFGEREEYRIDLKSTRYRVRVGDNYFLLSPLTGGGQMGFGGGLNVNVGALFSAGAYSQRFRFQPGKPSERGASLTLRPNGAPWVSQLSANAVARDGGPASGRVLSGTGTINPYSDMVLDVEYAGSRSDSGVGRAHAVRLSGGKQFQYDVSQSAGDLLFAGPTRGAKDEYASLVAHVANQWELTASTNRHRFGRAVDTLLSTQQLRITTVGARYAGHLSLEYNVVASSYSADRSADDAREHFARAHAEQNFPVGSVWGSAELGSSRVDSSRLSHPHRQLSLGTSLRKGSNSLSIFTEIVQGSSLLRGGASTRALGGSVQLQLLPATTVSVNGYTARYSVPGLIGYSQFDARLTQELNDGASMSVRTRVWTQGNPVGPPQRISYLEYQMPLGIPVGRAHSPGRVNGQVVDRASGRGVAGALIRLGSRTALTDDEGRVSFIGIPSGNYRVSLGHDSPMADAVLSGDPTIAVDSSKQTPVTFQLALARRAGVTGTIGRWDLARTSLDGNADSLSYSGPLAGIPVAMIVGRDTLYRATDQSGSFSFTDLPPGQWTVVAMGDEPAQYRYERQMVDVVLEPGATQVVRFRVIPRRREIKIIAGD